MFITIQYPITDLRAIFEPTNRLTKPTWPNPDLDTALRQFGAIGERSKGGVLQWPAEKKFCIAKNAIHIKELTQQLFTVNNRKLRFEGRFRRFFKPGDFTCKFEIAFDHPADVVVNHCSVEELASGVYDTLLKSTIDTLLKLEIRIAKSGKNSNTGAAGKIGAMQKQYAELRLFEAGSKLADLYLQGSTKKKFLPLAKKWWVSAGEPLALVTYSHTGKLKLPLGAVFVEEIKEHGILLHSYMHPVSKNRFIRCWLIGLDIAKKTGESISFLRQLIINLFRINAEKEALRQVLNIISANDFLLTVDSARSILSRFLEDASSNLLKKERFGIDQDKILYYAFHSEALADPGSLETLLVQLKPLENKYVLKNVEKLAIPEKKLVKIFIASSAEVQKEREKCIKVIFKVSKSHQHLWLEPVLWEYDIEKASFPLEPDIQSAINLQLAESEMVIFIFYSKIGKHTLEEYNFASAEKKRIMLFFKKGFLPAKPDDPAYDDLTAFKKSLADINLYMEYKGLQKFDGLLSDNLHLLLSKYFQRPLPISPRLG
jgi:hypothetical protein